MDILKNTTIIVYCYFINTHYGIYGVIKKRFVQISEKWRKGKKGVKFGKEINKKYIKTNKLDKNNSTKQLPLYLKIV